MCGLAVFAPAGLYFVGFVVVSWQLDDTIEVELLSRVEAVLLMFGRQPCSHLACIYCSSFLRRVHCNSCSFSSDQFGIFLEFGLVTCETPS